MSTVGILIWVEPIRFRPDFFRVIGVSVTYPSVPWARRPSHRRRSGRSSKSFLPYNSRPPRWTLILDSLRLCDSRNAYRFASHDFGHLFFGTTARESAMLANVCYISYMGFGLAHNVVQATHGAYIGKSSGSSLYTRRKLDS